MNLLKKKSICILLAVAVVFAAFATPVSTYAATESTSTENTANEATITLNKKSISLEKGKTSTLKATVENSSNKTITWSSSNKKVATVNSSGKVTAKGKGTCYVTAKIKGTDIKVKCKVTVKKYVTVKVKTTAYCGCKKCNGKWYGYPTASGKDPKAGRTIAVDKSIYPFGTKIKIGDTVYVAEDTGSGVKGQHIDIFFSSHKKALDYGVKYRKVKVYI